MKKLLLILTIVSLTTVDAMAQIEYKIITSVESIVSSGLGRSRLITTEEKRNFEDFTSSRSEDRKEDKRNKADRSEIRLKNFDETKLLNFFNIGGIRFQNIAANDAVVSSKLNSMVAEGWELAFVTSGVETDSGKGDGQGSLLHVIFSREIKSSAT